MFLDKTSISVCEMPEANREPTEDHLDGASMRFIRICRGLCRGLQFFVHELKCWLQAPEHPHVQAFLGVVTHPVTGKLAVVRRIFCCVILSHDPFL